MNWQVVRIEVSGARCMLGWFCMLGRFCDSKLISWWMCHLN